MFPLKNPQPNIDLLVDVLKGNKKCDKVMPCELIIDDEILKQFSEKYLNRVWVDYDRKDYAKRAKYWDNVIECYYYLGYSGFRVSNGITFNFSYADADSTDSNRETRKWSDHNGVIKNWDDFKNYPFPTIDDLDLWDYKYVNDHLKPGMGILACVYGGILEMLCEYLVGFEDMSYMIYDDEELLAAIFEKVGKVLLEAYEIIVPLKNVKAIFQGDDMGYTSGLMFSEELLRKYVFPWHKELANIAHKNNKVYFMHSCGNLTPILEDLIEIGIDAKHSFEDNGLSVIEYKKLYGDKVGIIGGVDVDKLCRYNKEDLKKYCLNILDHCQPSGRYAFGSGNSIANYVPFENFLYMLEIAYNYKGREDNL